MLTALILTATSCGIDSSTSARSHSGRDHAAVHHAGRSPSSKRPSVKRRIVREHERIWFATRTLDSAALAKGVVKVQQPGRPGMRVKTYRVVLTNGVVSHRTLIRNSVVRRPVTRIELHGTHVVPAKVVAAPDHGAACDPNYSGACVPIASDVDCAGGTGNGPAYVAGPVRVVGVDIYGLDADGNGWGCE